MRTSTKAAFVLALALAVTPVYGATRSESGTDDTVRVSRDNPIVRVIRNIKHLIVHILDQPAVPIPQG